ncbi:MAG: DNA-binding protein [Bacteroidales bacterium]|nr:DNA-binding protein [Bacteroidales bacterium]
MTLTFNELRRIKDNLPPGSIKKIANQLDINEETVRNYFGGNDYDNGASVGMHVEQGPDGGLVKFDDPAILNIALELLEENLKN